MGRKIRIIIFLIGLGLLEHSEAQDTGLIPVPVFTEAKIQSQVAYDSVAGFYTYNYTITNPATNTGEIWDIDINITQPANSIILSSEGLTIPYGVRTRTFDDVLGDLRNPAPMIPVGILVPQGWEGDVGKRGVAGFFSGDATKIHPGETLGGFEIISRGLPTIREVEIEPWWIYSTEGFATPEGAQISRQIKASLAFKTKTLGPTAPPADFKPLDFLNHIISLKHEAYNLGWIIQGKDDDKGKKEDEEKGIMKSLDEKLNKAKKKLEKGDTKEVIEKLKSFIHEVEALYKEEKEDEKENHVHEHITSEAYALFKYNSEYLIERLGGEKEKEGKKDKKE